MPRNPLAPKAVVDKLGKPLDLFEGLKACHEEGVAHVVGKCVGHAAVFTDDGAIAHQDVIDRVRIAVAVTLRC